jgi:hypothetical protein
LYCNQHKYEKLKCLLISSVSIIILKPGPAQWVTRVLTDPGLEPGQVEEQIGEEKTWLTRQNPVKNPVATRWLLFFVFTKTTLFWFKKKLTRVTRPKPGTPALDRAGSENYGEQDLLLISHKKIWSNLHSIKKI